MVNVTFVSWIKFNAALRSDRPAVALDRERQRPGDDIGCHMGMGGEVAPASVAPPVTRPLASTVPFV
jgi:hypothetical protein